MNNDENQKFRNCAREIVHKTGPFFLFAQSVVANALEIFYFILHRLTCSFVKQESKKWKLWAKSFGNKPEK